MLDLAWHELSELAKSKVVTELESSKLYGLLCIRLILFITNKAKWGQDKTEYSSLDAIFEVYKAGKDKLLNKASSTATSTSPSSSAGSVADNGPSSTANACLLLIALQRQKIPKVVGHMRFNNTEGRYQIFKLMKLDINGAEFLEHKAWDHTGNRKVTCKLNELNKWVEYKGKLQTLVDLSHCLPCINKQVQRELSRCNAFIELCALGKANDPVTGDLLFTTNPDEIVAGRAYKKGELKLVCVTDMASKVQFTVAPKPGHQQSHGCQIDGGAEAMWALPPQLPKLKSLSTTNAVVGPMWWVKSINCTTQSEAVNMVWFDLKGPTLSFKALTNSRALQKFDKLMKATWVDGVEGAPPPCKKQKMIGCDQKWHYEY
jgi:hypothetical protein